jgi:cobalt-zinc-cadmium efflux system outer membrane protein
VKFTRSGLAGSWARQTTVSVVALALAASLSPMPSVAQEADEVSASQPETLTLSEALLRAAQADPALVGTEARLRAGEAAVRQADVRPNPSVGLMVENLPSVGGSGIADRTETTLTYEQRYERGGDQVARAGLARQEAGLIPVEAGIRSLDRLEQAQRAWVEALVAQAELEIARDRLAQAESFQAEVQRRVSSARDPLFAGARAESDLALAQIDFDQAEIRFRLARAVLARFWQGGSNFALDPAVFEDTGAARELAGDPAEIDLARFVIHQGIADARVRVEQARATPDATVSVGVRHFWEGQDVGLVVGGSIPLGRYDRNQGAIERARAEGVAAAADLQAFREERQREIARLQVVLAASAMEVRRITEESLPQAERAVVLVREGFARGGFSYNDVVATQNALLELRARRVSILRDFHFNRARLDRLTGAHADLLGLEFQP